MSLPFLGEVRLVSFNYAPTGWALCNGQLLPINQNQALFSILGTTYGGDGITTFALPNLQGRAPLHVGGGFVLGDKAGEETHTLTPSEAGHSHTAVASSNPANTASPASAFWANGGQPAYLAAANGALGAAGLSSVGGGQAHENMGPFLVINFVIALQGIFPSRL